jgi:phage-related protein
MSEDLFYNRDRNISGQATPDEISTLNFYPAYGSKVEFTAKSFSYETSNSYYNTIPDSLNSLKLKYRMRYDLSETNAAKLVDFLESKSGYIDFIYSSDINIYRRLSGYCENYAINHINNNHYEVAAEIDVDQAPTLLNWSGMTFLNHDFKNFSLLTSYKKYDVVYTGINSNKLNNFYYCSGDHTSSVLNSPTGINSAWTQEFFFEPDIGLQNDVKLEVKKVEFKNSFQLRIKTKKNITPININYKFSNITNKQLKSMLHFLENKAGYRRFRHQIPSVYNRPKVFMCPQWSHTWKYYDSNDLDVSFIEDALGIIPSDT